MTKTLTQDVFKGVHPSIKSAAIDKKAQLNAGLFSSIYFLMQLFYQLSNLQLWNIKTFDRIFKETGVESNPVTFFFR